MDESKKQKVLGRPSRPCLKGIFCHLFQRANSCSRLAVPAKYASDKQTNVQERPRRKRQVKLARTCHPQELIQRNARPRSRQVYGPHVVKRHTRKKIVNPEWQPFELSLSNLWHLTPSQAWNIRPTNPTEDLLTAINPNGVNSCSASWPAVQSGAGPG